MNVDYNNPLISKIYSIVQHYNHKKYWKYREYVVNSGGIKLLKLFRLFYIKRCDAFNKASMGTDLGQGAIFETPPLLPHGLNGIIVNNNAKIGKNVRIYHQVTIGDDDKNKINSPTIGDNVVIYPEAKILGPIKIGNNCRIGANAVVVKDVPDNTLVVCEVPRYINKNS